MYRPVIKNISYFLMNKINKDKDISTHVFELDLNCYLKKEELYALTLVIISMVYILCVSL